MFLNVYLITPHPNLPPERGKETSSKILQVPIPLVLGFVKTYSTQPTFRSQILQRMINSHTRGYRKNSV
jgi:hypothetical protein